MAPTTTRKRKSDEMEDQPAGAVTPTGSPAPKKMRITQQQKQALMDNLQLESKWLFSYLRSMATDRIKVTERARQLRAGYALQCADLRARIERRVNRIPLSIRKMTMGELMQQDAATKSSQPRASPPKQTVTVEILAPKPLPPLPVEHTTTRLPSPARSRAQAAPVRGKKRMSLGIQIASDKENEHEPDMLPVTKNTKRAKTTTATTRATRTASQTAAPNPQTVLSPRSNNSRTLPRSPIKDFYLPGSPAKSMIARPTTALSPIRPASPLKSAATAATSAISASVQGMIEQAKRGGTATAAKITRTASKEKKEAAAASKGRMLPPPRPTTNAAPSSPQRAFSQASTHSNSTDISTASSGTTVIKPKRGGRIAAATSKVTAKATLEVEVSVEKKKGGMARAASAAKTALKRNANAVSTAAAGKKVVVAEPAAGRRVLRKRA